MGNWQNIIHQSQPNPGPRVAAAPCTLRNAFFRATGCCNLPDICFKSLQLIQLKYHQFTQSVTPVGPGTKLASAKYLLVRNAFFPGQLAAASVCRLSCNPFALDQFGFSSKALKNASIQFCKDLVLTPTVG